MTSTIPEHLMFNIKDKRLKSLVKQVWERLPSYDQYVLSELLLDISDSREQANNVLGIARPIAPVTLFNGCTAKAAEDLNDTISLKNTRGIVSDNACMYVIAHEFAHVVLRHSQMSAVTQVLENLSVYSDDALASRKEWDEDCANLLAWTWGFQNEMEAFFDSYPEARQPRWYVEIEVGGPN